MSDDVLRQLAGVIDEAPVQQRATPSYLPSTRGARLLRLQTGCEHVDPLPSPIPENVVS